MGKAPRSIPSITLSNMQYSEAEDCGSRGVGLFGNASLLFSLIAGPNNRYPGNEFSLVEAYYTRPQANKIWYNVLE